MTDIESESSLTDRYQTTVPAVVRRALKLGKRDQIVYRVQSDGSVVMRRKAAGRGRDPVIAKFLEFLARDMEAHPERVRAIDARLIEKARRLTKGVKFDMDAALPPDQE